ncbi:hypothetical protein H9Q13_04950 [Pontibacter sp. JH31]|uniref:STAS/SEC14 domain-containing protein n=1 Tax=Pontibacter aquaedesilientis TaxID=2766980 RepID=A0ABR7XDZ1_9BACT|nr:hypothetical protein [Pontibacter aquaedesilientis]MBD1396504.1 hypothetical protein [Pontibacter aquaedesilientis]
MILLQNSVLKLEYNPATDILQVRYPDLQSMHLSEIKHNLNIMVDTIRNYDVRKLLLDASHTNIEINDEENRAMSMELAAQLSKTRLIKLARIQPASKDREVKAQENIEVLQRSGLISYELRSFTNHREALAWLEE